MTATVLNSIGRAIFQLGFELCPIWLTGGIAPGPQWGGTLPIIALTEGPNLLTGLLSGNLGNITADNFFAHFRPMPGTNLQDNDYGRYPFANQNVAANAVIVQPLRVSLMMSAAIRESGGNTARLATFLLLKNTLDNHVQQGGLFTVLTPTYIYQNCVLLALRDVSGGESKQPQIMWQWDFEQPLVTQAQADGAQGSLMSKITNGTQTDGAQSGPGVANTQQGGIVPATQPLSSSGTGAAVSTPPTLSTPYVGPGTV